MKITLVILLAISSLLTGCGDPGAATVRKYTADIHRAVNEWQPSLEPAWTSGVINGYVYERLIVISNHQKAAAFEASALSDYMTHALTAEERQRLRGVLRPLMEEFGSIGLLIALEHQP